MLEAVTRALVSALLNAFGIGTGVHGVAKTAPRVLGQRHERSKATEEIRPSGADAPWCEAGNQTRYKPLKYRLPRYLR